MIDFDIAKTWHKIFAEQVEFVVLGLISDIPSPQAVCDDAACKLGQWLHGAGKGMENLPAYAVLLKAHRAFHRVAGEYLVAAQGQGDAAALGGIEQSFKDASLNVLSAIDGLTDEMSASPGNSTFTTQFAQPAASGQLVWDDSLNVGLPTIDEQHKAIFEIISKLAADPEASLHSERVVDCLSNLGKILELHFSVEEAHMRQLGVSQDELRQHQQDHAEILYQYANINIQAFEQRGLKVKDIADQAIQWAIDHVVEFDLGLQKYLRAT